MHWRAVNGSLFSASTAFGLRAEEKPATHPEAVHFPDVRVDEPGEADGSWDHDDLDVGSEHYRGAPGASVSQPGFITFPRVGRELGQYSRIGRRTRMSIPSTAVIVRGMEDEGPFLHEFLSHYLALGFDRIYYIDTSDSDQYRQSALAADLRGLVLKASNSIDDWQHAALNEAVHRVREDWVLNVDADEFLCLGSRTIQQFLQRLPPGVESIRFRWLMCLSTRYTQESVLDICLDHIAPSRSHKSMARTAAIRHCGIHDITTVSGQPAWRPVGYGDAFILHFACRGFFDLMNRIVGRNYQNAKSGTAEIERLIGFFQDAAATEPDYPFRFNLYRMELSFPSLVMRMKPPVMTGAGIDNAALKAVFSAQDAVYRDPNPN